MKGRKGDRGRRRTEAWEKGSGDWKQRKALVRKETTFEPVPGENEDTVINALSDTFAQFAKHITRREAPIKCEAQTVNKCPPLSAASQP